jgi:hypothetical protein
MRKSLRRAPDRLISGKLRAKAARAGAVTRTVAVDGTEYAWSYRHGWQVWGRDLKVVSLSVALRPERTRELILDLTAAVSPTDPIPAEARIEAALPDAIRSAMAAGWVPDSRGRAFRFEREDPL